MKNDRGFTLLEVITVISIIAALSAIVTVGVTSRTKAARDASVKNNLMVLRGAVQRHYLVSGKFPGGLDELKGREAGILYLKWEGAGGSGRIGYDPSSGSVFLLNEAGARPAEKDAKGVSYSEY